jgi:hypothetical protein
MRIRIGGATSLLLGTTQTKVPPLFADIFVSKETQIQIARLSMEDRSELENDSIGFAGCDITHSHDGACTLT